MKKILFIFFISSANLYADGPRFQHSDTFEQQEFENVYQTTDRINSRITSLIVNVKDYGAKGDGVTNDIASIRAAVLAVSTPTCGTVYFPNGHYSISDTVYWPSCVTLQGNTVDGTVLQAAVGFISGDNIVAIRKPDGTSYSVPNEPKRSIIRSFTIDGSSAPAGFTYGISMDLVENGLIENCRIYNTPKSGIYTGGVNVTNRQKYPAIRNVTLDSTGWNGGADQIGGGGIYGASYYRIVCINSPGTCIDQVDTVSGVWEDILSTGSTGGNGGVWTDFGMTNSVISRCRLYNTSIHVSGNGTLAGTPKYNIIEDNYLENAQSAAIRVHSDDSAAFTIGNRIIGNVITSCLDDCLTVGYSSGAIIIGNSLNAWNASSSGYAVDILGMNNVISGNYGKSGNSTTWLKQSAVGGPGTSDMITGNNFPGAIMTLDTVPSVSSYVDIVSGIHISSGDINTIAITDYSGGSTITGWSSFTTKTLQYKKIGKMVFVFFDLRGTSNSTSSSFTMPFIANGSLGLTVNATQFFDNGSASTLPGQSSIGNGNSTVNLYTNWNAGGWTASNTKIIIGSLFYEATL